jgi:hypothetical protein
VVNESVNRAVLAPCAAAKEALRRAPVRGRGAAGPSSIWLGYGHGGILRSGEGSARLGHLAAVVKPDAGVGQRLSRNAATGVGCRVATPGEGQSSSNARAAGDRRRLCILKWAAGRGGRGVGDQLTAGASQTAPAAGAVTTVPVPATAVGVGAL